MLEEQLRYWVTALSCPQLRDSEMAMSHRQWKSSSVFPGKAALFAQSPCVDPDTDGHCGAASDL